MRRLLEFFHRQVVDAEHFDPALDDEAWRADSVTPDVVRVELRRAPGRELRVLIRSRTSSDEINRPEIVGRDPVGDVTSMTRVRPSSKSSGSASVPGCRRRRNGAARRRACRRAHSCEALETFDCPPRAIRLIGSRLNGVFPG